ncbi:MAG: type II secretion system F family protein [Pirellulales bacterium]
MSPFMITIAAFVGVSALIGAVAVYALGSREGKVEERLGMIIDPERTKNAAKLKAREAALYESLDGGHGFFETLVTRFARLRLLFQQANTNLTAPTFFGLSGGLAVAGGAVSIASGIPLALMPFMAAMAGVLPFLWLLFRRRRRMKKFASQLPDALDLMARSLRAGQSLQSGFHMVGQEMSDPIATEFGRCFEEQNLGVPLDEAMRGMTDRVPNLDLSFFSTAVILQRQTGGDLAEILDKIASLIRARFKIYGQIQALTGEGRLSGVVRLALPPVLFLAVYRLNPDYIMPLFQDPMGKQMLAGGVVLQLLGAIVIKKIISIKV